MKTSNLSLDDFFKSHPDAHLLYTNFLSTNDSNDSESDSLNDFALVEDVPEITNGKFTISQLRWQLKDRNKNGLKNCVTKVGKRLYIHIPSFIQWLKSKGGE